MAVAQEKYEKHQVANSVKYIKQQKKPKCVRKLSFNEHSNSSINFVQKVPPQVTNIQGEMNKWFRLHDETNPAASVAVRHLLQELINDNVSFTEYVRRLAELGQTEVPCYHLLEVSSFILRSNPTCIFFLHFRNISQN